MKSLNSHITLKDSWTLCFGFFLAAFITMLPSLAFAQAGANDTVLGNPLCHAAGWMTGNLGKGFATVGVGAIALKAMQGTVTWGLVAMAGAGIAIIFGAAPIVTAMRPGTDMTYCNSEYTLTYRYVRTAILTRVPIGGGPTRTPGRISLVKKPVFVRTTPISVIR